MKPSFSPSHGPAAGPTFQFKEDLKKLGAKFNGQTKAWVITKKERPWQWAVLWNCILDPNGRLGYQEKQQLDTIKARN